MALTVVDNRIILDECDSVTGWTATDGPTLFTASPTPIEVSGCLGMQVSNGIEDAYTGITSDDYSSGGTLSVWVQDRAEFANTVTGGIGIQVGDGTNRIAYHVGGNDGTAFRHDVGPVKWACFLLDLANKPANFTAIAGSEANLNEAAITQVGVRFDTDVKSVGGTENCFWDIIRFADNGVGIEVYGGTALTPESLSTLAGLDRASTNQIGAIGIIREVGSGVYSIQGNVEVGDPTSTNDTYIDIISETIVWEDRGLSTNNFYRFTFTGNSTGNSTFNITGSVLSVPSLASARLIATSTNINSLTINNTVINGFDQGVQIGNTSQNWNNNSFTNNGQIEIITGAATLIGSIISGYEGTAGTGSLLWNINDNGSGSLDNINFTKGTASTHAIEFGTNSSTSITLTGITFNGYDTTSGLTTNTDAVLYFPDTGANITWTVTASDVNGVISYRKARAGDTVNILNNVNVTFTGLQDNTEVRVFSAGTTTELDGIENATTGTSGDRSFVASVSSGTSVDYRIHNKFYEIIEVYGFTWPSTNQSLPIQQRFDRNYLAGSV